MSVDPFGNLTSEDFPDPRVRRLAAHLHRGCKSSHTDQCDWFYGNWNEPRYAHAVWYQKAEKLVEVIDGSQREEPEPSLGERIQMLKGTLAVKDVVDTLKNRVEEILTELDSRGVGVGLIGDERVRQIEEEGWTPEHDAEHDAGELLSAAACYLFLCIFPPHSVSGSPPQMWPDNWRWNPSDDPVRNLVKAGALIAAEIDRLKRAEADSG